MLSSLDDVGWQQPAGERERETTHQVKRSVSPILLTMLHLVQAVLAGDPHQLGPILRSRPALAHGLGLSLLERLMMRDLYQRDEKRFADHGSYDPLLVSTCVMHLCMPYSRIIWW